METLRGKTYAVQPIDPRDFERRLPKALALLIAFALGSIGWWLIWLVTSTLIAAVAQ